jgi:Ribbon-helix-helix protein, copG family
MVRPKKQNAVKAGYLRPGLMRFSFIADKDMVALIKEIAKEDHKSIKDLMEEILLYYLEKKRKNEFLMKKYFRQKGN